MKRKDILKKLTDKGFTFQEGGSHTKAYDCNGIFRSAIGRHTEIPEKVVCGISLKTAG